jgi:SAM-dependent methyltransferase
VSAPAPLHGDDRSRETLASDRSGEALASGENPPFDQHPRSGKHGARTARAPRHAHDADHASAEHRGASAELWEAAAPGWVRRQEAVRALGAPVAQWLVQAIDPRPGQRVLELAAGLGEVGLQAAELLAPNGGVILSDQAEAMLDGARARAAELALTNVEFQAWNAEWIDLPVATVDAVVCRWGYMLMTDPLAALRETRRVLRPGGRLALAVWDAPAANPWALAPRLELLERGLAPPPPPESAEHVPGPFALGDPERLRALLGEAGFVEVTIAALDVAQLHESFDAYWETILDLSRELHDLVLSQPAAEVEAIRAGVAARLAPHTAPDGTLKIPGRSLVGRAEA